MWEKVIEKKRLRDIERVRACEKCSVGERERGSKSAREKEREK